MPKEWLSTTSKHILNLWRSTDNRPPCYEMATSMQLTGR